MLPSRLNEPEQILYAHCRQLIGAQKIHIQIREKTQRKFSS